MPSRLCLRWWFRIRIRNFNEVKDRDLVQGYNPRLLDVFVAKVKNNENRNIDI